MYEDYEKQLDKKADENIARLNQKFNYSEAERTEADQDFDRLIDETEAWLAQRQQLNQILYAVLGALIIAAAKMLHIL